MDVEADEHSDGCIDEHATLNDSLKADAQCVKASYQVKPVRNQSETWFWSNPAKTERGKDPTRWGPILFPRITRSKTEDAH